MPHPKPRRSKAEHTPERGSPVPAHPGRPPATWLVLIAPALLAAVLAWPTLSLRYLYDDYDFLGRGQVFRLAQLVPESQALFWRPISREAYFALLYAVAPNSPVVAHALNAVLLALAAALVTLLGIRLAGPRAGFFAGAAFASLGAAPVLVGWICCDQDLFAIVFALAAIHLELSGRTPLALLATLGALLSKETAVALVPAIAFIRPILGRSRLRAAIVPAALYLGFVGVWAAAHPGIRGLLVHRMESADPAGAYLSATRADLPGSIWKIARTLINVPLGPTEWPVELDMVLPFAVGMLALGAWLTWQGDTPDRKRASMPRVLLLAALLTLPAIVVVAGLVWNLNPYHTVIAGFGTSLAIGLGLARVPRVLAAVAMLSFLMLGIYGRGMDLGVDVPTERTLRAPSDQLATVQRGFHQVLPRVEGRAQLLVSVQTPDSRSIPLHLIRLQAPRIWYRNPSLDVMYPERRSDALTPDRLLWVSSDLSVHAIDPATLTVVSSGAPDSAGYRTTLRSYARGLAGTGETARAVDLLLRMEATEQREVAYNRRLAAALLLAENRKPEADGILADTPRIDRNDAITIAYEIVSIPSRLDVDAATLDALGLGANDSEAVREVMRRLALNRHSTATIRFAQRLLALRPEDPEATMALRALRRGADVDRVTTPVEHDIAR